VYLPSADNIADLQPHDVATPKCAVDRDIEERSIAKASMMIEVEADSPYLLWLQRSLSSNFPSRLPSLPLACAGIKF
jgi:hypothetical protein